MKDFRRENIIKQLLKGTNMYVQKQEKYNNKKNFRNIIIQAYSTNKRTRDRNLLFKG